MSQPPEPSPEEKDLSSDRERAEVLAAVLRDEHERVEWRSVPAPSPRNDRTRFGVFLVSLVLAVYVWFGSPSWARPYVPPAPTPVEEEAGLRLAMYLQAQRIEVFREANRRLPLSLDEAGERVPGVEYDQITGRVYRLRGRVGGLRVTYVSAQSAHEFLGDAHRVVLPRARRGDP